MFGNQVIGDKLAIELVGLPALREARQEHVRCATETKEGWKRREKKERKVAEEVALESLTATAEYKESL